MKKLIRFVWLMPAVLWMAPSFAQLCQNPADTVYGLGSITGVNSGQIVGVSVSDGKTTIIGTPAASSANANGLGFSQVDGRFYFFNQCGAGATEFVSYDPVTSSKVSLAIPSGPALPTTSSGKIRSGTVSRDGSGYYMIFPGATTAMGYPITGPAFYRYDIALDTWTLITQSFKDMSGNEVAEMKSLNSGDMAFDGSDNLWILAAKGADYALYRINAPLPTTAVANVVVDTIIAKTTLPGNTISFTGIAFNSLGHLYLSRGSYSASPVPENNLLYEMTSATDTLAVIDTLPNGFGDDLTSCTFPVAVLPLRWINFQASYNNKFVALDWKVAETDNTEQYNVEYRTDGDSWHTVYSLPKTSNGSGLAVYHFNHTGYTTGNNYYRIVQVSDNGKVSYSAVRLLTIGADQQVTIGPNPARDLVYFRNISLTEKHRLEIFDNSGRLVYQTNLTAGQQSVDVSSLYQGYYILRLTNTATDGRSQVYRIIKE